MMLLKIAPFKMLLPTFFTKFIKMNAYAIAKTIPIIKCMSQPIPIEKPIIVESISGGDILGIPII